jgi:hypothetical protein
VRIVAFSFSEMFLMDSARQDPTDSTDPGVWCHRMATLVFTVDIPWEPHVKAPRGWGCRGKTVAIRHGRLTLQMFMAGFITSRTKRNCPGPGFLFSFCSDLEFQTLVVLLEYMPLWSWGQEKDGDQNMTHDQ